MRAITTLEELDEMIRICNRAEQSSDDALRAVFETFCMQYRSVEESDVFSELYRHQQLALYEHITGRPYSPSNEVTKFDVDQAARVPFPFYTQSATTVGDHIAAVGFIIRRMALPAGSRIIEFGPGWGNTTIALAKMGYHVTAVDIENAFCDLLRLRALREGCDVTVVNADFFFVERASEDYDAVLFYESFHHCADHLRLLRALHRVVKAGGSVFFAGEPITADFPVPWGLRLDGSSLWAMRKNGWLELGFSAQYFRKALERTGWLGTLDSSADVPWLGLWTARRPGDLHHKFDASAPPLRTQVGHQSGTGLHLTGEPGVALYGPYITLPPGTYKAQIYFSDMIFCGSGTMDVSADAGDNILATKRIQHAEDACIDFSLADDTSRLEVRLFADRGLIGCISSVVITPR